MTLPPDSAYFQPPIKPVLRTVSSLCCVVKVVRTPVLVVLLEGLTLDVTESQISIKGNWSPSHPQLSTPSSFLFIYLQS